MKYTRLALLILPLCSGLACRLSHLDTKPLVASFALLFTPRSIGGVATGLTGPVQLTNNGTDALTLNSDGPFIFPGTLTTGAGYNVQILSHAVGEACTISNGAGTVGASDVTSVSLDCVTDTVAPTVVSTTPADLATGVLPNPATITVVFDEPMDTTVTPVLTAEALGASWTTVPNTGTKLSWQNPTTLLIKLSWVQFPERTNIRWTLTASGLIDLAGNPVASDPQQTFQTTSRNLYFPISDTGQTDCWYYNGASWTADTGCVFTYPVGDANYPFGQDGHYAGLPLSRNFVGPTAHATYSSDYTTTDQVTGLVWKTCDEGVSGSACGTGAASTMTWFDSINACASLNSTHNGAGYAGRKDWRLPTRFELESIADLNINAAISPTFFPAASTMGHATSNTNIGVATFAWVIGFYMHSVDNTGTKTGGYVVRCVSGPATPPPPRTLVDNLDGTITDSLSGLIWQKCGLGRNVDAACSDDGATADTAIWANALAYCENLSLASRTDWRLPSKNELMPLVDMNLSNPAIDAGVFPATASAPYWTSTSAFNFGGLRTYYVHFNSGVVASGSQTVAYYVRCVTGP